jgi:hypothetical protein
MAATTLQAFPNSEIKLRFAEPYVSDGLNAKIAGIIPRGIYRGYNLVPSGPALTAQLDPDASNRHLAVYETLLGRSLTLTRSGGPISVPLGAFAGTRVYVVIFAQYTTAVPTIAELRVYSVADFNSAPEKNELIVLGIVDVPGAGVISASDISYSQTTYPWKEGSIAARPWEQIVRNGDFEESEGFASVAGQGVRGFSGVKINSAGIQVVTGNSHSGAYALQLDIPDSISQAYVGPGNFNLADPLSGGTVPVRAGQLIEVSLWLAGQNVDSYTFIFGGFRFFLNFFDASDAALPVGTIASDPAVHIGTFGYVHFSELFVAPADGYFTWYMSANVNLAAGFGGDFFVDDLRIFLQPRDVAQDDDGGAGRVMQPNVGTMALDVYPSNKTTRAAQSIAARTTAVDDGTHTVVSESRSGADDATSVPRYATPHIFKKIDQDFAGFGISGTETTADQDSIPHAYKLLHAYGASQTDPRRIRVYSRTTAGEYVITSNAQWGGGGSQAWFPDDTSFDAVKFTVGGNGPRWESRDGVLPVSWLDSAWTGTVGAGRGLVQLLFAASLAVDQNDATSPVLKSNKRAADHPGFPGNPFKLIGEFLTGTGVVKARIYSGGVGPSFALLSVTLNASYNPATSLWTADNTTIPAMRLTWEVAAGAGLIFVSSKVITTVPWADSFGNWDTVQTPGVGSLYTTDEFRWLGTRTKTVFVQLNQGIPQWNDGATEMDWETFTFAGTLAWLQRRAFGDLWMPLPIPQGAVLTRVRISGFEVVGFPWFLKIAKDTGYDFTTPPGTIVHTNLDSDVTSGAGGAFVVVLTCAEIIDKTAAQYWALIEGGNTPFGFLVGVEVRFNESFVTNY